MKDRERTDKKSGLKNVFRKGEPFKYAEQKHKNANV